MTVAELLRRKLEHSDGLIEQGVPVDALVSLVEAAEKFVELWDEEHYPQLRRPLAALREALEEK